MKKNAHGGSDSLGTSRKFQSFNANAFLPKNSQTGSGVQQRAYGTGGGSGMQVLGRSTMSRTAPAAPLPVNLPSIKRETTHGVTAPSPVPNSWHSRAARSGSGGLSKSPPMEAFRIDSMSQGSVLSRHGASSPPQAPAWGGKGLPVHGGAIPAAETGTGPVATKSVAVDTVKPAETTRKLEDERGDFPSLSVKPGPSPPPPTPPPPVPSESAAPTVVRTTRRAAAVLSDWAEDPEEEMNFSVPLTLAFGASEATSTTSKGDGPPGTSENSAKPSNPTASSPLPAERHPQPQPVQQQVSERKRIRFVDPKQVESKPSPPPLKEQTTLMREEARSPVVADIASTVADQRGGENQVVSKPTPPEAHLVAVDAERRETISAGNSSLPMRTKLQEENSTTNLPGDQAKEANERGPHSPLVARSSEESPLPSKDGEEVLASMLRAEIIAGNDAAAEHNTSASEVPRNADASFEPGSEGLTSGSATEITPATTVREKPTVDRAESTVKSEVDPEQQRAIPDQPGEGSRVDPGTQKGTQARDMEVVGGGTEKEAESLSLTDTPKPSPGEFPPQAASDVTKLQAIDSLRPATKVSQELVSTREGAYTSTHVDDVEGSKNIATEKVKERTIEEGSQGGNQATVESVRDKEGAGEHIPIAEKSSALPNEGATMMPHAARPSPEHSKADNKVGNKPSVISTPEAERVTKPEGGPLTVSAMGKDDTRSAVVNSGTSNEASQARGTSKGEIPSQTSGGGQGVSSQTNISGLSVAVAPRPSSLAQTERSILLRRSPQATRTVTPPSAIPATTSTTAAKSTVTADPELVSSAQGELPSKPRRRRAGEADASLLPRAARQKGLTRQGLRTPDGTSFSSQPRAYQLKISPQQQQQKQRAQPPSGLEEVPKMNGYDQRLEKSEQQVSEVSTNPMTSSKQGTARAKRAGANGLANNPHSQSETYLKSKHVATTQRWVKGDVNFIMNLVLDRVQMALDNGSVQSAGRTKRMSRAKGKKAIDPDKSSLRKYPAKKSSISSAPTSLKPQMPKNHVRTDKQPPRSQPTTGRHTVARDVKRTERRDVQKELPVEFSSANGVAVIDVQEGIDYSGEDEQGWEEVKSRRKKPDASAPILPKQRRGGQRLGGNLVMNVGSRALTSADERSIGEHQPRGNGGRSTSSANPERSVTASKMAPSGTNRDVSGGISSTTQVGSSDSKPISTRDWKSEGTGNGKSQINKQTMPTEPTVADWTPSAEGDSRTSATLTALGHWTPTEPEMPPASVETNAWAAGTPFVHAWGGQTTTQSITAKVSADPAIGASAIKAPLSQSPATAESKKRNLRQEPSSRERTKGDTNSRNSRIDENGHLGMGHNRKTQTEHPKVRDDREPRAPKATSNETLETKMQRHHPSKTSTGPSSMTEILRDVPQIRQPPEAPSPATAILSSSQNSPSEQLEVISSVSSANIARTEPRLGDSVKGKKKMSQNNHGRKTWRKTSQSAEGNSPNTHDGEAVTTKAPGRLVTRSTVASDDAESTAASKTNGNDGSFAGQKGKQSGASGEEKAAWSLSSGEKSTGSTKAQSRKKAAGNTATPSATEAIIKPEGLSCVPAADRNLTTSKSAHEDASAEKSTPENEERTVQNGPVPTIERETGRRSSIPTPKQNIDPEETEGRIADRSTTQKRRTDRNGMQKTSSSKKPEKRANRRQSAAMKALRNGRETSGMVVNFKHENVIAVDDTKKASVRELEVGSERTVSGDEPSSAPVAAGGDHTSVDSSRATSRNGLKRTEKATKQGPARSQHIDGNTVPQATAAPEAASEHKEDAESANTEKAKSAKKANAKWKNTRPKKSTKPMSTTSTAWVQPTRKWVEKKSATTPIEGVDASVRNGVAHNPGNQEGRISAANAKPSSVPSQTADALAPSGPPKDEGTRSTSTRGGHGRRSLHRPVYAPKKQAGGVETGQAAH